MITVVKTRINAMTALVLATDRECPDLPISYLYRRSVFSGSLVVGQYIVLEDSNSCSFNEISHSIYAV